MAQQKCIAAESVLLLVFAFPCVAADESLVKQRERLTGVKIGTTSDKVRHDLGDPDDVRRTSPSGRAAYIGNVKKYEVERWAYGTLGERMFTATGFVSVSSDRLVVAVETPDCFSLPGKKLPKLVAADSCAAVTAPGKLVCEIDSVEAIPRRSVRSPPYLKFRVSITNGGDSHFQIRHHSLTSLRWLLITEVRDASGILLYRDHHIRYSSLSRHRLFTIRVDAGTKVSDTHSVSPEHAFGRLPNGEYDLRVYFPLHKLDYYPSNQVRFERTDDGFRLVNRDIDQAD